MMFGKYRQGQKELPRVIHISIVRYRRDLPQPGEALEFLVTIHEEGTGVAWQQNIAVAPETEAFFLDTTRDLHLWSLNRALTPQKAHDLVQRMGRQLYDCFLGPAGHAVLKTITPTAILFDVDETILNLPWEVIANPDHIMAQQSPFGRLISTRTTIRPGRNPLQEDAVVRILAIANPTLDLSVGEAEIAALADLEGRYGSYEVKVNVLAKRQATREKIIETLATGDYDILHFAGHGFLDPTSPGTSALRLADGDLTADQVLQINWKAAPYFVFGSACESGRAVGGQRLVSDQSHCNGMAAAFLATGVYGYAGYFWPVTEVGAAGFARTFYRTLFTRENVGLAFQQARQFAVTDLGESGDLTGYSAVLFGDAASEHRRDLALAA